MGGGKVGKGVVILLWKCVGSLIAMTAVLSYGVRISCVSDELVSERAEFFPDFLVVQRSFWSISETCRFVGPKMKKEGRVGRSPALM